MERIASQTKSSDELREELRSSREALREFSFGVHRGGEKGVRKIRVLKKEIARLLTLLNEKR